MRLGAPQVVVPAAEARRRRWQQPPRPRLSALAGLPAVPPPWSHQCKDVHEAGVLRGTCLGTSLGKAGDSSSPHSWHAPRLHPGVHFRADWRKSKTRGGCQRALPRRHLKCLFGRCMELLKIPSVITLGDRTPRRCLTAAMSPPESSGLRLFVDRMSQPSRTVLVFCR
jgi:hypothetical protein